VTGRPQGTGPDGVAHVMDPVERVVHRVLGLGIVVSVVLLAAGLLLGVVRGQALQPRALHVGDLLSGLASLEAAAYISLGVIVLIATPFVRVAGALVAFAHQRDRRFVAVTALVLAVMCVSVLVGRA